MQGRPSPILTSTEGGAPEQMDVDSRSSTSSLVTRSTTAEVLDSVPVLSIPYADTVGKDPRPREIVLRDNKKN